MAKGERHEIRGKKTAVFKRRGKRESDLCRANNAGTVQKEKKKRGNPSPQNNNNKKKKKKRRRKIIKKKRKERAFVKPKGNNNGRVSGKHAAEQKQRKERK